jgi:exopolyphosphatase/pppGpp-phosphohydrolase
MRLLSNRPAARLAWVLAAVLVAAPARAALHGGIEVGAKGVKATAVEVSGDADAYDVKVLLAATENTTLTAGLGESGRFAPDAVKATAAAVAKFADTLRKEHKVADEHLYVVGSSGLFSAVEDKPEAVKANKDALAAAVQDACGLKMTFIDVKREAELSIDGVVPRKYLAEAALIDIGSGNTKGGFRDGDKGAVTFGVPYGSVTFADAARKREGGGTYADKAAALRKEVLAPALRKSVEQKPALAKRERIYLGGGAVWAMASLVRPGGNEPYLAVTSDDVAAYGKLLAATPGEFPKADLASLGEKERAAAEKEIARVKKTFSPEQLLAGAEILAALSDEFGFKDKKVFFARNAYLGWILAYVTEQGAPR